ncbi:hypothetical protein DPX16_11984 [Anabarilius grahami]|uniref:Uncharacterized protein n=1 Tax=Anabarilius grahami TaxID=495550 RepID=A0A3N0YCM0_ANAGA|nr:hypothetical protein DPX16_11984 [Anabarilius grahami]
MPLHVYSYILVLSSRGGERTSTVSPFSQCGMFPSHQAQANKQSSVPAVEALNHQNPKSATEPEHCPHSTHRVAVIFWSCQAEVERGLPQYLHSASVVCSLPIRHRPISRALFLLWSVLMDPGLR